MLNGEIDGRFPAHHPDPTVPKNLEQLIAAVRDAAGAISASRFDGDADRIGAVDDKGGILFGDQLMVVLARDVLRDASGRHDHRRRQGEPGAVRRDRRAPAASR